MRISNYYPLLSAKLFQQAKPAVYRLKTPLLTPSQESITCEWVFLYPQQEPEPISFLSSPSLTYPPKPTNSSLTPPEISPSLPLSNPKRTQKTNKDLSFSMGAGFSAAAVDDSSETSLGDIPEGCVASILLHLTPTEICKLARLNRAFRGAALADFVWESKLPRNYGYLVDKLFDGVPESFRKKEIYARLCRPNSFDGGTKEVWLEKESGGICMSIAAKGLAITGIDDKRYWNYIPMEESRFHTVAYLQQIWWFEVDGKVEFCFPAGTYSLFFRIQLGRPSKRFGRRFCNTDHIHGWDLKPVRFQLLTSDGQHALSQCYLDKPGDWIHYHVGDFVVENPNALTEVKFSMTQIDCTHTKGGLCVDSVLIYPSNFREKGKAP